MTSYVLLWALPGGPEMILIILALVLLFGGRKIPELMKGLGQGMKEFKKARNEGDKKSDGDKDEAIDDSSK
ncbi:twin-arginine translocase TatA/TatE family subunit [Carboxylicivirga sp. A043]|uniref:Sec-independent protein translocase subunit TatA/TatB n=1 Tax=Carboxylicivirga litoralis TaxID=2816963 RepID=UPI0021CB489D|nr:twin-arginine translocase TatA/TatE family subunit [Carboxylicivirga sp. A043]MCU4156376.1 twin-arginine translocase TatA/TatE family subunit [Carboxylicivirga sp. A043]